MESNRYELHFAPLQGYTDSVSRNAFDRYFGGVDVYYTPFIRIEKGGFRNRDVREIQPERNSVAELVPQILPGSRDEFCRLTDLVAENGYASVDINLGCPFPLIAGRRKGAGMLPYPDQVAEVLEAIREYPEIRFSLKMRLGWENPSECVSLTDVLNALRLRHITIHARTGKQQYKGAVNPEAFAAFYERSSHPLFYNGDLHSGEEIGRILQKFPLLRGVSLGRGLLSSPFVGKEFKENVTFSEKQRMSAYFSFHEALFSAYSGVLQGEIQVLNKMKTLWEYFLPESDRKWLKCIKKAQRLSQYREAVEKIFGV